MVDHESNLQLAKLWITLEEIRNKIDNEAIPLGMHLSIEDPEPMQALGALTRHIENYFGRRRLAAELSEKRKRRASINRMVRKHLATTRSTSIHQSNNPHGEKEG